MDCPGFLESPDPRKRDCARCGKPLAIHHTPESPHSPRRRHVQVERDLTHEAARGATDPARLIEHAETRAATLSHEYVPDPMLVAMNTDKRVDAREELADCRNRLVWFLEEQPDHPRAQHAFIALRLVALAYDHLQDPD
jgi:hypothetical protein